MMEEGSFSFRAAQKHALDQLMRDKKIVEEANTVGTNKITEPGCMCYCQKTDEKVLEHLGPLFPYCGAGCLKSDAKAAYISAGTSYYLRDLKTLSLLSILLFILCCTKGSGGGGGSSVVDEGLVYDKSCGESCSSR